MKGKRFFQMPIDTVPTEFVHRKKSPGPSGVAMARAERSRKRDEHNVCKYYKWGTRISFNNKNQ